MANLNPNNPRGLPELPQEPLPPVEQLRKDGIILEVKPEESVAGRQIVEIRHNTENSHHRLVRIRLSHHEPNSYEIIVEDTNNTSENPKDRAISWHRSVTAEDLPQELKKTLFTQSPEIFTSQTSTLVEEIKEAIPFESVLPDPDLERQLYATRAEKGTLPSEDRPINKSLETENDLQMLESAGITFQFDAEKGILEIKNKHRLAAECSIKLFHDGTTFVFSYNEPDYIQTRTIVSERSRNKKIHAIYEKAAIQNTADSILAGDQTDSDKVINPLKRVINVRLEEMRKAKVLRSGLTFREGDKEYLK